jgi:hypothetical protein
VSLELLPLEFIVEHSRLSWAAALLGFDLGWLPQDGVVSIADQHILNGEQSTDALDLATMDGKSRGWVLERLRRLSQSGKSEGELNSQRTWLLLGLLWLRAHERDFADPLSFAEGCVDDVGNPLEAITWLRFMPHGPDYNPLEHSAAENYDRLMRRWKQYLADLAPRYLVGFEELLQA